MSERKYQMELYDVVMKLIGPVVPVGETKADEQRFENLKELTDLVDLLLTDIDTIAGDAGRPEFSIRRAGEHCARFLDQIGIQE
jgi:hypothetical protein